MRQRPSRMLWIAAILVSLVCVSGLAYGLITDWDAKPETAPRPAGTSNGSGSGFGAGVMIGVGAGILIGSLIALRKR